MLTMRWTSCPNEDCMVLHTDRWLHTAFNVTRDTPIQSIGPTFAATDPPPDADRQFYHALACVDGVKAVSPFCYECIVHKGRVFAWGPIQAAIEAMFLGRFSTDPNPETDQCPQRDDESAGAT